MRITIAILLVVFFSQINGKANWPRWRGDGTGMGFTESAGAGTAYTNVLWRAKVRGLGYSSPIVFNNRAFVTTAYRADLANSLWIFIVELSSVILAGFLWWFAQKSEHRQNGTLALILFSAFAVAIAVFEIIQRTPSIANILLSGSYAIRIWLISAFVSIVGLVTAIYIASRSRRLLASAALFLCIGVFWLAQFVPDRIEISRVADRWLYWLVTCIGIPLGFPNINFNRKYPITSVIVAVVVSAYCMMAEIFGERYLRGGFWMISGLISMCAVAAFCATLGQRFHQMDCGARSVDLRSSSLAFFIILGVSGLIFWRANYLSRAIGMELEVVCIDLESSKVLWESGYVSSKLNSPHYGNSFASPTPATDGTNVYAYFGAGGTACFDKKGRILWVNDTLPIKTSYGAGSSPVLYQGKVIIACDNSDGSYVAALDCSSGKVLWKTTRAGGSSYGTPALIQSSGGIQLVVAGGNLLAGYDPATGNQFWHSRLPIDEIVPSPLFKGGHLYVSGGNRLIAYETESSTPRAVWQIDNEAPFSVSPVAAGPNVYMLSDEGLLTCLDCTTGKSIGYLQLRGSTYFSSPIIYTNVLLCCSATGDLTFVKIPELCVLAEVSIGRNCYASPAISRHGILVRTSDFLTLLGRTGLTRTK